MQYWDEVLFPEVLRTIRGEKYLRMSDRQIADELIALAKRAIGSFMFPKVSLDYADDADEENEVFPHRFFFIDDIGSREIAILVAWMKYYWADLMVSNADNFQNIYFDNNIQSFSPGNVLHNYIAAKKEYYDEAKALESRYYRSGEGYTAAIGGTIDGDDVR